MKRTALNGIKQIKDTHLDNLEPEIKEYRIACDTGLYFRVSPTGKKSWQVRFKDDAGKWKWHSMGSYPQLSLVEAKLEASTIFLKLRNKEAVLTKKEILQKTVVEQRLNLSSLMYEWLKTKKTTWAEITIKKETQSIEKRILSVFGDKDFSKITERLKDSPDATLETLMSEISKLQANYALLAANASDTDENTMYNHAGMLAQAIFTNLQALNSKQQNSIFDK